MNNEFVGINEIFEQEFNKKYQVDLTDENNIYITCKINKKEAVTGCTKKIKIKRIITNGSKKSEKINIKIPKGIKNNQKIILRSEGNYSKKIQRYADLVIKVKIKQDIFKINRKLTNENGRDEFFYGKR